MLSGTKNSIYIIIEEDNKKRRKIYNWLNKENHKYHTGLYLKKFNSYIKYEFQFCDCGC
jgi:hypothetical protein